MLLAREVARLGVEITWENIGDPIQKGELLPSWIKEKVADHAYADESYGYVDTQGIPATRAFLADRVNARGGTQITCDDIVFFNGHRRCGFEGVPVPPPGGAGARPVSGLFDAFLG